MSACDWITPIRHRSTVDTYEKKKKKTMNSITNTLKIDFPRTRLIHTTQKNYGVDLRSISNNEWQNENFNCCCYYEISLMTHTFLMMFELVDKHSIDVMSSFSNKQKLM